MYHYVRDTEYIAATYGISADLVNQLVQLLRKREIIARMAVFGNRGRGLIVQDDDAPVQYHFHLIIESPDIAPRLLKAQVLEAFHQVLNRNWQANAEDIPTGVRSQVMHPPKPYLRKFRIVLCLLQQNEDASFSRCHHFKTEFPECDEWYWLPVPYSAAMREMEYHLKPRHWLRVRRKYIDLLNHRAADGTENMPLFVTYLEALHAVDDWMQEKE